MAVEIDVLWADLSRYIQGANHSPHRIQPIHGLSDSNETTRLNWKHELRLWSRGKRFYFSFCLYVAGRQLNALWFTTRLTNLSVAPVNILGLESGRSGGLDGCCWLVGLVWGTNTRLLTTHAATTTRTRPAFLAYPVKYSLGISHQPGWSTIQPLRRRFSLSMRSCYRPAKPRICRAACFRVG